MRKAYPRLLVIPFLLGPTALCQAQDGSPHPEKNGETPGSEVRELRQRVEELERRYGTQSQGIDLSGKELQSVPGVADSNPLSRPWYENIDVSGFGAVSYLDTGNAGEHPNGGFVLQQSSLFIDARAWEGVSFHFDIQAVPLGEDGNESIRTGEIYAHVRELWKDDSGDSLGLKAGRFYVPFGEEYTWFLAPDNPLISDSAPFPYGFDEGVELYGDYRGVGWIAAISDGTEERSHDDHPAKAINFKVFGKPCEPLYLSGSLMHNGNSGESAIEFGGSAIEPVGVDGPSTAGVSPNGQVDATLYELDAKCRIRSDASLALSFGHGSVDDRSNAFDRDFRWFSVEPRYEITPNLWAVARLSEIGTYDSDEGYHFDGEILAGGNEAFGYDTRRLQRISAGLGWKPNPRTILKLEIGRDRFWVIDSSPFQPADDRRDFLGFELVVSF